MNYQFRIEKATTFLDLMPLSLLKAKAIPVHICFDELVMEHVVSGIPSVKGTSEGERGSRVKLLPNLKDEKFRNTEATFYMFDKDMPGR